jgi:hypothetical protein
MRLILFSNTQKAGAMMSADLNGMAFAVIDRIDRIFQD